MPDPYDLRARAVYDDNLYPRPRRGRSPKTALPQTPNRALLDAFMARPETACHIPVDDWYQFTSTRCALRRMIDLYHYPLTMHTHKPTLTIHINKEDT